MDKTQRLQLLDEQDRLKRESKDIEARLSGIATTFERFAQALSHDPTSVLFRSQGTIPDALGNVPIGMVNMPQEYFHDWDTLSNLPAAAKAVRRLREAKNRLEVVEAQLAMP